MKIKKLIIASTLTSLGLSSGSANALLYTDTVSFSNNNTANYDSSYYTDTYLSDSSNSYTYGTLSRFDSSLGTLTGVSIDYTSQFQHYSVGSAYDQSTYDTYSFNNYNDYWGNVYNLYEDASISGQARNYLSITLTDPYSTYSATNDYNSVRCSANDSGYWTSNYGYYSTPDASCSSYDNDANNPFTGSLNLSSFSLNDFIGNDALDLTFLNYTSIYAYCDDDSGAGCYAYNHSYWAGDVTVTYTYDAAAVPEPSVIALLGAGLIGLIGVSRRKKS